MIDLDATDYCFYSYLVYTCYDRDNNDGLPPTPVASTGQMWGADL